MTETASKPLRVLMVCMGNICRSPTAQGVLEHLVAQQNLQHAVHVDSAGTHGYHIGRPPDARSQQHARARGYDLSAQRARKIRNADFAEFDWILVMDVENERAVRALCSDVFQHKIKRLTAFCQRAQHRAFQTVPDPYYEGAQVFETVLDLCEDACAEFLKTCFPRPQ